MEMRIGRLFSLADSWEEKREKDRSIYYKVNGVEADRHKNILSPQIKAVGLIKMNRTA